MSHKARTVLHGIDQSVPTLDGLPGKGNYASKVMIEDTKTEWIYDFGRTRWIPLNILACHYKFADHGGNIGFIDISPVVPEGTIIVDGVLDVIQALTSEGAAEITLKAEAAAGATGDILAVVVIASAGTEGLHEIVPLGTAATMVKCTGNLPIKLRVTVAALTAGEFVLYLRCLPGLHTKAQESSSSSSSSSSDSSSSTSSSSSDSSSSLNSSSSSTSSSYSRSTSSSSSRSTSSSSSSSYSRSTSSSSRSESSSSSS